MDVSEASYQIIAELLEARTGQHLTESRRWRVNSALAGIYRANGIDDVDQLAGLLTAPKGGADEPDLSQDVVEALLNNETYFFRDKPTFDQLPNEILPELARRRRDTKRLSIWSAGCSTGQEAYSLAMLFVEQADRWQGWTIDILGTDVSERAIRAARTGIYSSFEVQRGLGVTQMLRHFDETPCGWQVRDEVRQMVRFAQANILGTPPCRTPFDLVLCRNVLLYFDRPTRSVAFARLAGAVMPDGYLMLGAGETVIGQTDRFVPTAHRASFFERVEKPLGSVAFQKIA